MGEISYSFARPPKFGARIMRMILLAIGLSAILFFLMFNKNLELACGLALFSFLVQWWRAYYSYRYYIYKIDITKDQCSIQYLDMNEEKEITGASSAFEFSKGHDQLSKAASLYLRIRYEGKVIIRQFENGEWNRDKIKEVLVYKNGNFNSDFMNGVYGFLGKKRK